jgi:hypothetical protein
MIEERGQLALESQYPSNEPRGHRPAGARKEAYAKPNAYQAEIDGGWHVGFSLCSME